MKTFNKLRVLAACAVLALAVAGAALAAKGKPIAAGKVGKVDTAAKTFVVSNKKKGDATVTYTDKTVFNKAPEAPGGTPAAGTVADLKEGVRVRVHGAADGSKITATEVTIGGAKKAKAPKAN
jgi:hypothetical protein